MAAAREPHGIDAVVIGDVEKGLRTLTILACKMPGGGEALRVEVELDGSLGEERAGQRAYLLGHRWPDARAGGDHADPECCRAHP